MKRNVYADNAATTKLNPRALEHMMPYLTDVYGNPSSMHYMGTDAERSVRDAREKISGLLGCESSELYFTAGGSEADNWALIGTARARAGKGKHIISTKIEHSAILYTLKALEKEGFRITLLDVNEDGFVDIDSVKEAICDDTILISVMYANNEIGTIQPIQEIAALARQHGIVMHTDAVQAVGHVELNITQLGVDLLSVAAHKFGGPKGVGALYIRKGLRIQNLTYGGHQERSRRAGTENVAGIVGMAYALEYSLEDLKKKLDYTIALRDNLIEQVLKIPYTRLNGHPLQRLPGNTNFSIEFIEGEALVLLLSLSGICASSGSACSSGTIEPSHVLMSIGLSHVLAHGSLRLSIDSETTQQDIDYIVTTLSGVVQRLRDMSPLWDADKQLPV